MLFLVKSFFYFKNRMLSSRLYRFLQQIFHFTYLTYSGVETRFEDVTLVGLPIIKKYRNSKILIGKNVTFVSNSRGNVAGVNHPVILATLAENAIIQIGDGCGLSGSSICAVKSVRIGKHSGLGANSSVYDTDFHALDAMLNTKKGILDATARPVEIGENVWVAANALILKGVRIGDDAIIGAGSVVKSDVEKNMLVEGNPAVAVREIKGRS
jgi:acetyltransferase-like isoleucine patch superfamily enzyme